MCVDHETISDKVNDLSAQRSWHLRVCSMTEPLSFLRQRCISTGEGGKIGSLDEMAAHLHGTHDWQALGWGSEQG